MKPLGRKHIHKKKDFRLHENNRKIRNWWEGEIEPNKTMDNRNARKEIQKEMEELDENILII